MSLGGISLRSLEGGQSSIVLNWPSAHPAGGIVSGLFKQVYFIAPVTNSC